MREELQEWLRFIQAENYLLKEVPNLLFQQAANQSGSSVIGAAAKRRLERGGDIRPGIGYLLT